MKPGDAAPRGDDESRSARYGLTMLDSLIHGIYDVITLNPVRMWCWKLRWRLGAKIMVWGTYIIPPTNARTVLCCQIAAWATDTQRQIIAFKQRELCEDIKRTTATWQET